MVSLDFIGLLMRNALSVVHRDANGVGVHGLGLVLLCEFLRWTCVLDVLDGLENLPAFTFDRRRVTISITQVRLVHVLHELQFHWWVAGIFLQDFLPLGLHRLDASSIVDGSSCAWFAVVHRVHDRCADIVDYHRAMRLAAHHLLVDPCLVLNTSDRAIRNL